MDKSKIYKLVSEGSWSEIDDYLIPLTQGRQGLGNLLLWTATLRARREGATANQVLKEAIKTDFESDPVTVASYAEELIQSGFWAEATFCINSISKTDPERAKVLALILFREQELWDRFDDLLKALLPSGGFAVLAQKALADIRRGRLLEAENSLKFFNNESGFIVEKLRARLLIANGQLEHAMSKLSRVIESQPNDSEALSLFGLTRHDQALATWRKSLEIQPNQAETLANRAAYYLNTGERQKAHSDIDTSLSIKPWLDLPVLLRANEYVRNNDFTEAKNYIDRAINRRLTPLRLATRLEIIANLRPKLSELSKEIQEAINKFPNNKSILLASAVIYHKNKLLDEAEKCYATALAINPSDPIVKANIAQLRFDQFRIEEALELWQSLPSKQDAATKINIANARLRLGDIEQAKSLFEEITLDSNYSAQGYFGLGEVYLRYENEDQAIKCYQKAILKDSRLSSPYVKLAQCLANRGDRDGAEKTLNQGLGNCKDKITLQKELYALWQSKNELTKLKKHLEEWASSEKISPDYYLGLAELYYGLGEYKRCETMFREARKIDERGALPGLIRYFGMRGQLQQAEQLASYAIDRYPQEIKYYGILAEIQFLDQKPEIAIRSLRKGLLLNENRLSINRQLVNLYLATENYEAAIKLSTRFFDNVNSHESAALVIKSFRRARKIDEAIKFIEKLCNSDESNPYYVAELIEYYLLGKQNSRAKEIAEQFLRKNDNNLIVSRLYIKCLVLEDKYSEAILFAKNLEIRLQSEPITGRIISNLFLKIGAFENAYEISGIYARKYPFSLQLWIQLVEVQEKLGLIDEQKQTVRKLIGTFPPEQVYQWASLKMLDLGLGSEAEAILTQWQKDEPEMLSPRWAVYRYAKEVRRMDLMELALDAILKRSPGNIEARLCKADLYSENWQMELATAEVQAALGINPNNPVVLEAMLNLNAKIGDYDDFDSIHSKLNHIYGDQHYELNVNFFFNINCHPYWDEKRIYKFYQEWYDRGLTEVYDTSTKIKKPIIRDKQKIKIGYVSPDFHRHAVAYFSEPLMMCHDRSKFEIYAFSHLSRNVADEVTDRFKSYADHWVDTSKMQAEEVVKLIREKNIDILVDLAGHTAHNGLSFFRKRPAPIQCTFLFGSGQTTGLEEIDYLITDNLSIPKEHEEFISEKVYRLPITGFPFLPNIDIPDPKPLPVESNGFITFGVVARPVRVNKRSISVWAQVLNAVADSIIVFDHMPYTDGKVQDRILREFQSFDLREDRIIFRNTRPYWDALSSIDILLDTFPSGSTTTVSDAIWMNRLSMCLASRPPMGRMSSSQVAALDLSDLCIASNSSELIEKTVALAKNREKLVLISKSLRQKIKNSALSDYSSYARYVEKAYEQFVLNKL
jgi:predicted O-linked N-acetylglucosamine transferase (SPINDLY family)